MIKKKTRKITGMVVALALVLSVNVPCFAKGNAPAPTPAKSVQAVYTQQGSSTIELPGDTVEVAPNNIHMDFASGGPTATHQFITNQGINIVNGDKGYEVAQHLIAYKTLIMEYSDKPDEDEKDYVFAYHFYNPYTGRNYLPSFMSASKETALVRFMKHAENARANYHTNREYAMQELGRACHYLSDMNVPYHAANLVAGLSYHSQYEDYVNERNYSYLTTTSTKYDQFPSLSFSDYCRSLLDDCAKYAYSYKDLANASNGLLSGGDKEKWEIAAKATMKYAQESTAAFLYRFLQEVGQI